MKKKPSMDCPPEYIEIGGGEGPALLVLVIVLALLLFLISGCASTRMQKHEHRWDKDTGRCWICGVTFSPMKVKSTQARLKDNRQTMINAIMAESGLPEPEATILWERYKLSGTKGFANYLIQTNPFFKIDRVYIDFVERVKVRTKILKRGRYEK
jgi:hypothetical protein